MSNLTETTVMVEIRFSNYTEHAWARRQLTLFFWLVVE